ncbi:MAG: type II toxin-antitoxin system antitoxin SocA domain-containing protein [Pseudomonadota bacterium]
MFSTDIFDEKKASQAAAYLLLRSGGRMPALKLLALLYLAERLSFQLHSEPLIGDCLVSLSHGPTLSITCQHMNGELASTIDGWGSWLAFSVGKDIRLQDGVLNSQVDDLLELSDSDLDILEKTWSTFGHMSQHELLAYTQENCSEWQNPGALMIPISHNNLFDALGFSQERKRDSLALLEERNAIARSFKQACA